MSIPVMNAVWDGSAHKGSARLVLLAIADHARNDGTAWPSQRRLAERTGLSSRQVRTLLKKLEASGELRIERRPRRSCVFTVTLPIGGRPARKPAILGDVRQRTTSAVAKITGRVITSSKQEVSGREGEEISINGGGDVPPNRKEPLVEPPDKTGVLHEGSSGFASAVETLTRLKGSAFTPATATDLMRQLVSERPSQLVFEAIDALRWTQMDTGGFRSKSVKKQAEGVRSWVVRQRPSLMDEVRGLLERVGRTRGKQLVAEASDGERDTPDFMTTEQLRDLQRALRAAVARRDSAPFPQGSRVTDGA